MEWAEVGAVVDLIVWCGCVSVRFDCFEMAGVDMVGGWNMSRKVYDFSSCGKTPTLGPCTVPSTVNGRYSQMK